MDKAGKHQKVDVNYLYACLFGIDIFIHQIRLEIIVSLTITCVISADLV